MRTNRNRYINDALTHYNGYQRRLLLEKKLEYESALVKKESIFVLQEFEGIDFAD